MVKTYSDVIDAMIKVKENGDEYDRLVLTEESMDTFLVNASFNEEDEERMENAIGSVWTLPIESGDGDYLVTRSGEKIQL